MSFVIMAFMFTVIFGRLHVAGAVAASEAYETNAKQAELDEVGEDPHRFFLFWVP